MSHIKSENDTRAFTSKVTRRLSDHVKAIKDEVLDWAQESNYGFYEAEEFLSDSLLKDELGRMFRKGWSESDAFRYMTYSEEIDPRHKEEYALRKMESISNKYR